MLLRGFELLPPALDRVLIAGESPQRRRHVGQIAHLKSHIAGMTGRRRPDVGVAQRVRDRAVPARALAEHAATPGTAAIEALLDCRQHFVQQEVLPKAHRRRVDVLIAAEPGEAIGKGDDDGRHVPFPDQPVEPFRQILAKAHPIRVGQAAAGETDQIHQQGQSLSVMPCRDVHIDGARRRITQHIALEGLALDRYSADGTQSTRRTCACVPSLCFCRLSGAQPHRRI